MSNINIGRDNSDLSFRYKMPRLVTKVEGRGNGIKTVLVNVVDVAKALHVLPHYPTKYFGIELGAQSKFDKARDCGVVNGSHNAGDLAKLLDKFIATFVLCPTCKLPEIKMDVQKSKIKIDCAACGHNSILKTPHKLAIFILKNPPDLLIGKTGKKDGADDDGSDEGEAVVETKAKKKGADKKEKKVKKVGTGAKGKKTEDEHENGDGDPSTAAAAAVSNGSEEKTKIKKKTKEGEEEQWFTDTSKEAQKKRQAEEFAEMKTMDDDLRKSVNEIVTSAKAAGKSESPVSFLRVYLATTEHTVDEILAELKRLQISRGFDDQHRIKVLLESILDSSQHANILEQFAKHLSLLKQLCRDRLSHKLLLVGLEEYIGNVSPKLVPRTPHILTTLYENDVLDEESIISWAESPPESSWLVKKETAVAIRKKAKPFIDWLKSAAEDEDDQE